MEQSQDTSLFGFGIDQTSKSHLHEAQKWARFLAIVGFVMCGIIILVGIFAATTYSQFNRFDDGGYGRPSAFRYGFGAMIGFIYIIGAVLYFFPCLFLLRFANHMRNALATSDQLTLNTSFQNLKVMFRYVGILTIVVLSFYAIIIVVALVVASSTAY